MANRAKMGHRKNVTPTNRNGAPGGGTRDNQNGENMKTKRVKLNDVKRGMERAWEKMEREGTMGRAAIRAAVTWYFGGKISNEALTKEVEARGGEVWGSGREEEGEAMGREIGRARRWRECRWGNRTSTAR